MKTYEELQEMTITTNASGRVIRTYTALTNDELIDLIDAAETYDIPHDEFCKTPYDILTERLDLAKTDNVEALIEAARAALAD